MITTDYAPYQEISVSHRRDFSSLHPIRALMGIMAIRYQRGFNSLMQQLLIIAYLVTSFNYFKKFNKCIKIGQ